MDIKNRYSIMRYAAKHLKDNLNALLNKIEKDKPGVAEIVAEPFRKM